MEDNKKSLYIVLIILLLLILIGIVYFLTRPKTGPLRINLPDAPVDTGRPGVYEDQRIKLAYPAGWAKRELAQGSGVELIRDNYIFTVITGLNIDVSGGQQRFSEISSYVTPWMSREDADKCINTLDQEERSVKGQISVHNLYFTAAGASEEVKYNCGKPTIGGVLWYGAYFSEGRTYFIGNKDSGQIVATIRYNGNSADVMPYQGNANLQQVLKQTSDMIKNMEIKQTASVTTSS